MPKSLLGRLDLPEYFNEIGFSGWGAEIGTYQGVYAADILTTWNGSLHCVDPFIHQPGWRDILNHSDEEFQSVEAECRQRLSPWLTQGRCELHHMPSIEAASQPWAKDLDFVYLDARHDYDSVAADLRAWWPTIRHAGLFGGHDFLSRTIGDTHFDVERAVTDWMREIGLAPLRLTVIPEGTYPTWFVRK